MKDDNKKYYTSLVFAFLLAVIAIIIGSIGQNKLSDKMDENLNSLVTTIVAEITDLTTKLGDQFEESSKQTMWASERSILLDKYCSLDNYPKQLEEKSLKKDFAHASCITLSETGIQLLDELNLRQTIDEMFDVDSGVKTDFVILSILSTDALQRALSEYKGELNISSRELDIVVGSISIYCKQKRYNHSKEK